VKSTAIDLPRAVSAGHPASLVSDSCWKECEGLTGVQRVAGGIGLTGCLLAEQQRCCDLENCLRKHYVDEGRFVQERGEKKYQEVAVDHTSLSNDSRVGSRLSSRDL